MAIGCMLVAGACARRTEPHGRRSPAQPPPDESAVQAPSPPPRPQPARPYNVLFIIIDALRADMPWAGYPRQVAPWLTEFAKRATLYPRMYSLSSYTAKAVFPALAGRYPSELKRDDRFFTVWFPSNVTVTERLQEAGYRTLSGQGHGYFMPALGLSQGFDDYRLLPGTFLDTKGVFDITSDRLNKLARTMLSDPKNIDQAGKHRFFAYFHFLDPHFEYFKHPGHPDYGNDRRARYDNEVHFTDYWVGDLVDWSLSQPWGKNTAVIITGDHGEGFGEHNHYRHAYELWEALVRTAMFVYVPGAPPQRIETPRSHIDLAPTIADLMGIPPDPHWPGTSLLPEVFGTRMPDRPIIVDQPRCDLMDRRRALIEGDYKLIAFGDDTAFSLYKVSEDFREEHDLARTDTARLEAMKAHYLELSRHIRNEPTVGTCQLVGAPPGRRW
jgi:choline-sulfatase